MIVSRSMWGLSTWSCRSWLSKMVDGVVTTGPNATWWTCRHATVILLYFLCNICLRQWSCFTSERIKEGNWKWSIRFSFHLSRNIKKRNQHKLDPWAAPTDCKDLSNQSKCVPSAEFNMRVMIFVSFLIWEQLNMKPATQQNKSNTSRFVTHWPDESEPLSLNTTGGQRLRAKPENVTFMLWISSLRDLKLHSKFLRSYYFVFGTKTFRTKEVCLHTSQDIKDIKDLKRRNVPCVLSDVRGASVHHIQI